MQKFMRYLTQERNLFNSFQCRCSACCSEKVGRKILKFRIYRGLRRVGE